MTTDDRAQHYATTALRQFGDQLRIAGRAALPPLAVAQWRHLLVSGFCDGFGAGVQDRVLAAGTVEIRPIIEGPLPSLDERAQAYAKASVAELTIAYPDPDSLVSLIAAAWLGGYSLGFVEPITGPGTTRTIFGPAYFTCSVCKQRRAHRSEANPDGITVEELIELGWRSTRDIQGDRRWSCSNCVRPGATSTINR